MPQKINPSQKFKKQMRHNLRSPRQRLRPRHQRLCLVTLRRQCRSRTRGYQVVHPRFSRISNFPKNLNRAYFIRYYYRLYYSFKACLFSMETSTTADEAEKRLPCGVKAKFSDFKFPEEKSSNTRPKARVSIFTVQAELSN